MGIGHLSRILIVAAFYAVVVPVSAGARSWSSPADDAVTFRLNPAHTNNINFTGGFSPNLKLAWSRFVPDPNWFLTPTIANGMLFIVERVHQGTPGDVLHALRLKDGHELWYKKFSTSIGDGFAAPAYDNGNVFVLDGNGVVHALSAAKGKKLWQTKLPKQYFGWGNPVVRNGQVFVSSAGDLHYSSLVAIDEATGEIQWIGKINYGGFGTPALDSTGGVYIAPPCNYYRFNTETGNRDWYVKHGDCHGGGGLTPTYLNGILFVQDVVSQNDLTHIYLFDAATGKEKGSFLANWGLSPAFYTDKSAIDRGVTLSGKNYETLTNWNVATKQAIWSYTPGNGDTFEAAPIVVNGMIFVSDGRHDIIVMDADTGAVLNTISPDVECSSHECSLGLQLVAGDGALAAGDYGELFVYTPN